MRQKIEKVLYKSVWQARSAAKPKPVVEAVSSGDVVEMNGEQSGSFVKICREPAYIEPDWGYVITGRGQILEDSLLPNFKHPKPSWRVALPSPFGCEWRAERLGRVRRFNKVASLRHLWEWNYYHFYLDVLGKLSLLESAEIDRSVPIVLGRYAMELPFVRQIIERGDLKYRNFIIQDGFHVQADEIIYCKTKQPYKKRLEFLLDEMRVPRSDAKINRRVFLTRSAKSPRGLLNAVEVEKIVKECGFELFDAGSMTINEQIKLFSETRYLVALHGAGVTNIMFRRDAEMSVLELHANVHISRDFFQMCYEYNRPWYHLSGLPEREGDITARFAIDPVDLKNKIEAMLLGVPTEYPDGWRGSPASR